MTVLAQEFMENFGYGNQPYIVWLHEDIDRKHMHIVSVRMMKPGKNKTITGKLSGHRTSAVKWK